MCAVCGCDGSHGEATRHGHAHEHDHAHEHEHVMADGTVLRHRHEHGHGHAPASSTLDFGAGPAGLSVPGRDEARLIAIERGILDKNDRVAAFNRGFLAARRVLCLNLVSSPGAGKTTLLEHTLRALKDEVPLAVIEGDQRTELDAERIRATGVAAIQLNTGRGCHLDAEMVRAALARLDLAEGGILLIENIGNLVCPSGFDLGEAAKVVLASVTEGEDKPLKYPDMFAASRLMLVSKVDLLPHLAFDLDQLIAHARRIRPDIETLTLSATTGEGMAAWLDWLRNARRAVVEAS